MTVAAAASYPFLVGDIGGTNVRFGVLDAPGAPLALLPRALTREHDSPIAALRAALDGERRGAPALSAARRREPGRRGDGAHDQRRLDRRRGGDRRCVRIPIGRARERLRAGRGSPQPRVQGDGARAHRTGMSCTPRRAARRSALAPGSEPRRSCRWASAGRSTRPRPAIPISAPPSPTKRRFGRSSIASRAASPPRRCCRDRGCCASTAHSGARGRRRRRAGPRRRSPPPPSPATTRSRPRRCTCSRGSSAASPAISRSPSAPGAVYLGGGIAPKIATVLSAGRVPRRLRAQGAVRALDAGGADLPHRRSGPGADRPVRHPRRPRPLHVPIGGLATRTRLAGRRSIAPAGRCGAPRDNPRSHSRSRLGADSPARSAPCRGRRECRGRMSGWHRPDSRPRKPRISA